MRTFVSRLVRLALWVAASVGVFGTAAAAQWNALYVFGDSYSDSGAGYLDSDGPTAVVYLARGLGIPFTYATDPARAGKSLNFAVSSAKTGDGEGFEVSCRSRGVPEQHLSRGMLAQVRDFGKRVQKREIKFDADHTLFFLAGGLNDQEIATEDTIANLETEIRALYALGGRHFRVAILPTHIAAFSEVAVRLNPAIKQIPSQLVLAGADIQLSHWGEFYDEIFDHPAKYGLKNTADTCAGRALFDQDPTPHGDPKTFYFYHDSHPSTAVHRLVGDRLIAELGGKS